MASRATEQGPRGFSLASMMTASFGKGPRGREVARAESAKKDSLRIPEARAAEAAPPIWKNDRREGAVLTLHGESLFIKFPPRSHGICWRKFGTKKGFRRALSARRNPDAYRRRSQKIIFKP